DENLRRRFEPSEARQRCFSNGPQGGSKSRNPLSPTNLRNLLEKAGFFSSVHNEDENLRRRFEPSEARQRCFSNGPQGGSKSRNPTRYQFKKPA
ncbi:hypothetical protein M2386_004829, partial [Erwinia rhapontici]|nr:hypothetical protein [Erwinia rhapontici]